MKQGFCLLELLSVMAILSVLATFGVHSYLHWQWRTNYLATLERVAQVVQQAQLQAQRGHLDAWLGVEEKCLWIAIQASGSCQQDGVLFIAAQMSWQAAFTQGQLLRFSAGRGLSGFGAGRIRLYHHKLPHHEAAVVVSALGRIRVCETAPLLRGVPLC